MREYFERMKELSDRIHKIILASLGVSNYYASHFEPGKFWLRLNEYQVSCDEASGSITLPAHADGPSITILHEDDVGGLQVLSKAGNWEEVKPTPNSFIVLIGDTLQVIFISSLLLFAILLLIILYTYILISLKCLKNCKQIKIHTFYYIFSNLDTISLYISVRGFIVRYISVEVQLLSKLERGFKVRKRLRKYIKYNKDKLSLLEQALTLTLFFTVYFIENNNKI
jgi:hypothetical protein